MLKTFRGLLQKLSAQPLLSRLAHLLVAFSLCVGLLLPLLKTLGLPFATPRMVLVCLFFLFVFQCVSLNRWARRIGVPLLLLLGFAALLAQTQIIRNAPAILSLLLSGQALPLSLFAGPLTLLLAFCFAALCHLLVGRPTGFYPAMLVSLAVLLLLWFYGDRSALPLCLPALGALGVLYAAASEGATPYTRSLPVALLAVLLAMALMPAGRVASPPLEEGAEKVRQMIYDYLFFTEPRSVYSITTDGYQPLGQDRLGGPATLSDLPAMQVRTSRSILLRGTIKDYYTGLAFVDSGSSRRYLMVDPRWSSLKIQLLDMQRPGRDVRGRSGLFEAQEVFVQMVRPGVSTLFMPQRFEGLSTGSEMVPYFNATSEVFITRDTTAEDHYTVMAYPFLGGDAGLEQAISESLQEADSAYDAEVRQKYLQLPDRIESGVYTLAEEITAGQGSPYRQALALERYLQGAFPYTLDQSTPPVDRDFVSWFLLTEREGYCTSFAAAMTIMARCVGLPSRYIEGYAVKPSPDGVAYVTGEDAHAWTELYFDGFGWVPFDPTPGGGGGGDGNQNAEEEPESSPPPMGDPADEDPTPSPSPSPEPTPSPTPDPADPDATFPPEPTPEPDTGEAPEITLPPEEEEDPPHPSPWPWILGALLLLLLAAALILRLRFTDPDFRAGREKEAAQKLMIWYRALQRALEAYGLTPSLYDSPLKAFEEAEERLGRQNLLMPVAYQVCYLRYGGRAEVSEAALKEARAAYVALRNGMSVKQRLRHLYLRLRYGLGNLTAIP